jgi:helix-turn-helix protein
LERPEYHSGVEEDFVLLSVAARETGYSAEFIRKQIQAGKLPGRKMLGRYWVVPKSALAELKARERIKPGRPPKRRPDAG